MGIIRSMPKEYGNGESRGNGALRLILKVPCAHPELTSYARSERLMNVDNLNRYCSEISARGRSEQHKAVPYSWMSVANDA